MVQLPCIRFQTARQAASRMTITLLLEQVFNGIQSGVTLFLVAAGLTVLGIMDLVFLAHGAQVMIVPTLPQGSPC